MKYIPILLIVAITAFSGTIHPDLQDLMQTSEGTELIPVFILVKGELDTDWVDAVSVGMRRGERQEFVVDALKDIADVSQAGVISELELYTPENVSNIVSLWLANAVYCEAAPAVIRDIASRNDITLIDRAAHPDAGLIYPYNVRDATPEELDKAITWSVTLINADDVWALGYDGSGVIVGVIDTGTDYNHMDLHNNMWHDTAAGYHYGWDFFDGDNDPMDDYGHGTHCSGSVLGDGSEGTQTGVAPGATCMALRINYYSGGEYTWIQAMEFGTDNGAAVLSMSLGSGQGNTTLRTAEENLLTAGVLHSVAAGNHPPGPSTILSSGDSPPPWFHPDQIYHGGQSAVVTVGATNSSDVIASFSNYGPVNWWSDYNSTNPLIDPDICGPGVDVFSTQWGGGYTTMSGTSMATPHLAGVVALILDANPTLSVAQIDSIIEITSVELGASGKDNYYGAGRVDALAAVQAALSMVGIADGPQGIDPEGILISSINPNPVHDLASFEIYTESPGKTLMTDFTMVQAGSLLKANGGYLIMEIESVLMNPYVWEALKRALQNKLLFIEDLASGLGMGTSSLRPEPISLD
ncbi:MAG: S8 family serine peptidase, partial [Candidatus Aegiribacteria sp.]|nr:S8 family serine peptidase [Candidatus Aegiribacteria sp.]